MTAFTAMGRQITLAAMACLICLPASAATINVDSLLDNSNAGDGLCTLREAVLAADLNIPVDSCSAGSDSVPDTIVMSPALFPPPLRLGVISLSNSLNIVDNSLTIQVPTNAGLSLIGDGAHPVLTLDQDVGASFSLNNTLIRDGVNSADGGGIAVLGGTGTVNLNRVTLTNNRSDGFGGGLGIASTDPLVLNLVELTISSNEALDGGAIGGRVGEDLTLNLSDSTLTMNTASGDGGGVHLETPATVSNVQTTVAIARSSLVENIAGGNGGGVMLIRGNQASNRSISTVVDSRFEGNQALSGAGGGLAALGLRSDSLSRIELRRNSFVENTAGGSGGGFHLSVLGVVAVNNSVIGNHGGTAGGANVSYFSAEVPYAMALIGNSFHYNVGGAATASSAGWDLAVTYPALAGSFIRYVGNAINNEVSDPGDSPCRLGTVPAAASFIGGHNRIRQTNLASGCVAIASDLLLPDLGLSVQPVTHPVHTQAALPQPGSALIDSWPDASCQGETGAPLSTHMLGDRRSAGVPINGDPRTLPNCDSGAIEAPAGALLSVTLSGTGTGTVLSDPVGIDCGVQCEAVYPVGSLISLSAGSAPGSTFVGWSGACSGNAACTVNLDQSRAVTAQFDQLPENHTVSVSLGGAGGGQVSSMPGGILCQPSCSAQFVEGTVLTLQANPAGNSQFDGWGGDCAFAGSNPSCQLTISANRNLSADFSLQPQTLAVSLAGTGSGSVSSTPGGIACPGDCDHSYAGGSMVTLTAQSDSGSAFLGWSGSCSGTAACSLTMDQAHTVVATFDAVVDPVFADGYE